MARILLELRFGRLLVLDTWNEKHSTGSKMWVCHCDCGTECFVPARYLLSGGTKSCGCLRRERLQVKGKDHPAYKHGHSPAGEKQSPTYHSYQAMMARCYDETSIGYRSYGAKGVRVCARWKASFANFLADMGVRPEGKTLDRKDPFKGYNPKNCKWSTREEQDSNKRSNYAEILSEDLEFANF